MKIPLTKICRLALLLILASRTAFAVNNVAVLELTHRESIQEEISIEESRHLTDELRKQAVITLPKASYSVLTRDNIIALMPADEKEAECLAESCAVEIGRAIGAEYASQGIIGKFGEKLTISVELYETMGGKLLSSIVFESENIDGLLNVIRNEAKSLFQGILDLNPAKTIPEVIPEAVPIQPVAIMPTAESIAAQTEESTKPGIAPVASMRTPQWIGISLAVAGIGAGVYGFLQNSEYDKLRKDYGNGKENDNFDAVWEKAENAKKKRNIGYIIGGVLLAGGITIYFTF
jgi:hypothetical protein